MAGASARHRARRSSPVSRRRLLLPVVLAALLLSTAAGPAVAAPPVRMNELQVIGTHNSYHRELPKAEEAAYEALIGVPDDYDKFLAYSHATIPNQFDAPGRARARARPLRRPGRRPVGPPRRAQGDRARPADRPGLAGARDQDLPHRRPGLQDDLRALRRPASSRSGAGRTPTRATCRCRSCSSSRAAIRGRSRRAACSRPAVGRRGAGRASTPRSAPCSTTAT